MSTKARPPEPGRRSVPLPPTVGGWGRIATVLLVLLLLAVPSLSLGSPAASAPPVSTNPPSHEAATGPGAASSAAPSPPEPTLGLGLPALSAAAQAALAHRTISTPLLSAGPRPAGSGIGHCSPSYTCAGWPAFAAWDNSVYVPVAPSSVDQILMTNYSVAAVIPVGSGPFDVAVDPALREVFVTNSGSSNVSIINGTTQRPIGSFAVQHLPLGLAVDTANQTVFVADDGTNNVSVYSISAGKVVATVAVGLGPKGVAWDPATNQTFVADTNSSAVSVLSASKQTVVATIPVGTLPQDLAVDNATGMVYVSNQGSNNLSVISAVHDQLNATIPVIADIGVSLEGVAYDASQRLIWVTGGAATTVVVNPSTESVYAYVPWDPSGITYDPTGVELCVTNSANFTFACLNFSSHWVVSAPSLLFHEIGLPTGTAWSVQMTGGGLSSTDVVQSSRTSSLQFNPMWYDSPTNFSYQVAPIARYHATPSSGGWRASALPSIVNITFLSAGNYSLSFVESGLPSSQTWSINLTGKGLFYGTGTITTIVPNGTYSYSVRAVSGYSASPSSGTVTVNGASLSVSIAFSLATYPVAFLETGLPTGHSWRVYLHTTGQNSTTTTDVLSVPNGTYAFYVYSTGWAASPSTGSVTVAGKPVNISVVFRAFATHPLIFLESGLPSGTTWTVSVNGTSVSTTSHTLSFPEPNGTYLWVVSPISGWTLRSYNGTSTLAGGWTNVTLNWTQLVTFSVKFSESGLPAGTLWNLTISGVRFVTTSSAIVAAEPNGSYNYSVPDVYLSGAPAYVPSPSAGSFTVAGGALGLTINFTLLTGYYPVQFNESGLPAGSSWYVAIAGQGAYSNTRTISVLERNGSYHYTVVGTTGYRANPANGSVTVGGAPVYVPVSFGLVPGHFNITFGESGLPGGTAWSVDLAGLLRNASTSSVSFAEPNGSYAFSIGRVGGYSSSPSNGTVHVQGASVAVSIHFTSTNLYAISFHESGLPNSTGWIVSIGNSEESSLTSTITLRETNGTYGYVVLPVQGFTTNSSGFVTVAGANVSVTIRFHPQTYPVIVVEVGLPNGTTWSVTLYNTSTGFNVTYSTNTSAMIFYVPNGTYAILVKAGGYSATLSTARITVAGAPLGDQPTVRFSRPSGSSPSIPALGGLSGWGGLIAGGLVGALLAGLIAGVGLYRRRSERREGREWVRELSDELNAPDDDPKRP